MKSITWVQVQRSQGKVSRFTTEQMVSAGVVVLAGIFVLQNFMSAPNEPLPNREMVAHLNANWPNERSTVFGVGSSSYCVYVGLERCVAIEPLNSVVGQTQAEMIDLREVSPQFILLNPRLLNSPFLIRDSLQIRESGEWSTATFGDVEVLTANR